MIITCAVDPLKASFFGFVTSWGYCVISTEYHFKPEDMKKEEISVVGDFRYEDCIPEFESLMDAGSYEVYVVSCKFANSCRPFATGTYNSLLHCSCWTSKTVTMKTSC